MTDIMELIEKYAETHATIARDLEKWGSHSVSARAKQIEYLTQIKSRIQAMQEVCDLTIKWKINPMIYYTQLIDAIDKLEALKND
jgi:hypothetical protein